jgi:hypothetical protein
VPDAIAEAPPRWEFYIGGALGLILGLGLRINDMIGTEIPGAILYSSIGAAARALVWFLVFSWLDGIPWRGALRQKTLAAGIVLLLPLAIVSGVLLRPVVMQTFCAFVALTLASTAQAVPIAHNLRLGRWVIVPVAVAALATYLGLVFDPAWRSASALSRSRVTARYYGARLHEVGAAPPLQRPLLIRRLNDMNQKLILDPLYVGLKSDPNNERLALDAAAWERARWDLLPNNVSSNNFLEQTDKVQANDPFGTEALILEFQFRLTVARFNAVDLKRPQKEEDAAKKIRDRYLQEAAKLLQRIIDLDPGQETILRYRLMQALLDTRDGERYSEAMTQAALIKELDENAPGPRWRLTDEQRESVRALFKPQ